MNNGGIQAHRYVIGKIVLFQFSTLQRELQLARNIYDKLNIPVKTTVHQFSPLYIHRQISGRGAFSPRANQSSRLPLIRARFCFMRYIFAWNATRRDVFLSLENRQIEYTDCFVFLANDLTAKGWSPFLDGLLFRIFDIVSLIRTSSCFEVDLKIS